MSDDDMYDHGEDPMFVEIFGEDTEDTEMGELAHALSSDVIEEETLTYLEWLLAVCKHRNGGELTQTAKQLNEYLDCWLQYSMIEDPSFDENYLEGWDQVDNYLFDLWRKIMYLADELESYTICLHRMPLTKQ